MPYAGIVVVEPFGVGLLVPGGRLDHAVLAEARVEIAEIDAGERSCRRSASGLPLVTMAPMLDSSSTFGRDPADEEIHRLRPGRGILAHAQHADVERSRATGQLDAGVERERLALVVEADAAREERDAALLLEARRTAKMSESCRKNARCSGKKRSKRVRLICRVSAVVPEKSGLSVSAAVSDGVIFQNASSDGSRKSSFSSVS